MKVWKKICEQKYYISYLLYVLKYFLGRDTKGDQMLVIK